MFIQTDRNGQYLYDIIRTNDYNHKSTKITEYPYSFSAMMKNSFASVKSFAFRYRLNLAIERAEEMGSCFISVGHKRRFCEGLSALGTSDNLVAAQLFLLSANVRLWHKVKPYLISGKIAYPFVELALQDVSDKAHSLYLAAKDLSDGSKNISLSDISNEEHFDFDVFRMICYSVAITAYGVESVIMAEGRGKKKNGKSR
jgi:hypothetical protein